MAESGESDNEEQEPLLQKALATALTPFYILTSRTAIKAYLSTLLFLLTSIGLLTISTTAYLFFYYNYIPPINLEKTVYLQYGLGKYPFATTPLDTSALISQQPYDVEISLQMPRTPTNLAAGNFMIDVQLLGPYNALAKPEKVLTSLLGNLSLPTTHGLSVLHHSRRPAILPYESHLLSLAHVGLHLPFHIFGLQDLDTNTLHIPMFELLSFSRGSSNVPTHVRVEVQSDPATTTGQSPNFLGAAVIPTASTALQIYSSRIRFSARFHGLRYVVYNYRILSFLTFSTLFYMVSVLALAVAWAAISTFFAKPKDELGLIKREGGSGYNQTDVKIKQETDESESGQGLSLSNVSDTPTQFPTGSGQMPIQYQGRGKASSAPQPESQSIKAGEAADDEEGFDDEDDDDNTFGRTTGRYEGDSGIGTSMESGREPAIVRRRSGRASGGGSGHG